MDKTLRVVCTAENVTRRAVQGYEKMGLVSASGRTDRGYLLYDEVAQRRIRDIKLYQEFGFSLKEIKEILNASDAELRIILEKRLEKMKEERNKMDVLIKRMNSLIEALY